MITVVIPSTEMSSTEMSSTEMSFDDALLPALLPATLPVLLLVRVGHSRLRSHPLPRGVAVDGYAATCSAELLAAAHRGLMHNR